MLRKARLKHENLHHETNQVRVLLLVVIVLRLLYGKDNYSTLWLLCYI